MLRAADKAARYECCLLNSIRRKRIAFESRADGDARRDGAQRERQGLTARLTDELNRWERAASRRTNKRKGRFEKHMTRSQS